VVKMKKMEIMRRDDDLYCRDAETHEFIGILRHSLGFYGESTGMFRRMKTTSLTELGYEEVPSGYIPDDGRYYHYHIRVTEEAPYWHPVSRAEIPQWKAGGISEHYQFRWD